jgi:hypothetical protein
MSGPRERHIERCVYNPSNPRKAIRKTRQTGTLAQQTYKHKGDIVLVNDRAKSFKVPHNGWY